MVFLIDQSKTALQTQTRRCGMGGEGEPCLGCYLTVPSVPCCATPCVAGLPLCSLGIMKDAWERLRQCISPSTTMCPAGPGSPILGQVFHFLCGSLLRTSALVERDAGLQADPKAITLAMSQQQQRAEVRPSAPPR